MKKKRVVFGVLFLLLLAIGGTVSYLYSRYLQPDRLVEVAREVVEEALGFPVDLGEARVVGMNAVRFSGFTAPSGEEAGRLVEAETITVRVDIAGLIPGKRTKIKLDIDGLDLNLRRDDLGEWNLFRFRREKPVRKAASKDESGVGAPKRPKDTGLDIEVRVSSGVASVADSSRGSWRFSFGEPIEGLFRKDSRREEYRLDLVGAAEFEGDTSLRIGDRPPWLAPFLEEALSQPTGIVRGDLKALFSEAGWEVSSLSECGFEFASESTSFTVGRFRVTGDRLGKEGAGESFSTASVETAELRFPTWNIPPVRRLDLPWTEIPEGPLVVRLRDLVYDSDRVGVHLSGLRFDRIELSPRELPWLQVLSNREGWPLENVDLEARVEVSTRTGGVEWSEGKIAFADGELGSIESDGTIERGGDWRARVRVEDLPIPAARVEEATYALGKLSGDMVWGESGGAALTGEGRVGLRDGAMGALRLYRGIERLLDFERLPETPFAEFSFDFNLAGETLALTDLRLDSPILSMTGKGTYGPGTKILLDVEAQAGSDLSTVLQSESAGPVIEGLRSSEEPLKVKITGTLDNPAFQFTAGKGIKIPLGNLNLDF